MNKRMKLIIIIVEVIVLLGLSGYRVYEYINNEPNVNDNNETVKKYKVTFDYGDNTVRSIGVEENKKIEFPEEPIREGYKFGGWLLNNALIDDNYEVKKDIRLKTNWINESIDSEIKILVYEINIRQEADVNSIDLGDVYLNQVYEVLDIVDTDIYTWYKIKKDNIVGYVANQKGEEWVEVKESEKNVKYYSVLVDEKNGTVIRTIRVKEGTKIILPESPSKKGYVFDGWTIENASIDENYIVNKDVVLKASWKLANNVEQYSVSFYADNTLVKKIEVDEGTKGYEIIEKVEAPVKEGYVFKNWKSDEIGYYEGIKSDVVYHAEYSKVYEITFIYDEFYTRIAEIEEIYFKSKQRLAAPPTYDVNYSAMEPYENGSSMKKGYEFIGWYTEDGEKFEWYIPPTDKITLIAKYEKINDDSFLTEYRKFETNELSAELIYELNKKTITYQKIGYCGYGSHYYFDKIGKLEDYSLQDKIINIVNMISPYVKCSEFSYHYENAMLKTGCYIHDDTVEKMYKYVYGNDGHYENGINSSNMSVTIPSVEYNKEKKVYYSPTYNFGTCSMYSYIYEKIADVKKINDMIEITKKAIYSSRNPMNTTEINYDYDERPREGYDGKELPEYNNFEEIQDKLDSYIFVFKKDSKDNYYLYEVKKEESK